MKAKGESPRHMRAFEIYHSLGPKRNYQRVASECGVSLSSVKLWSRQFGWKHRIAEREAVSDREISDRNRQAILDEVSRNKKIVDMALMKAAKAIADGKVRIQMSDLARLIQLGQLLADAERENSSDDEVFRCKRDVELYLETLSDHELELLSRSTGKPSSDTETPSH